MSSYRNSSEELNYFGSDLNKFINEFCTKQMTAINIDLLTYKRSKKSMRIIESKHENENVPRSQFEVLDLMKDAELPRCAAFGVYIIIGNYPYDTAKIHNLKTGKSWVVNRAGLIEFLEYRNEENLDQD